MKNVLQRAAIRMLQLANTMISDKGKINLPLAWRTKHLDYPVSKAQLSRVFRMNSDIWEDEPQDKGIEIRELAGYGVASAHEYERGFGNTRILRNGTHASLYINDQKRGIGFSWLNTPMNRQPSRQCEQAFVARTSILAAEPKKVIFTMQARYAHTDDDDNVTLREIFMPVVNDAGNITGLERIDPKDPDADIQTLRALIFFKVFTDRMAQKQPADVAACLNAVNVLPLDKTSTLRDYLMFRADPRQQLYNP